MTIAKARLNMLAEVTRRLELRWGGGAVQRLGQKPLLSGTDVVPTGIAALDEALGVGGLARGRIAEFCGQRSSGKISLATSIIAHAQRLGGVAAYIDVPHLLDPHYLAGHGVDLEYLVIAQPHSGLEALTVADALVGSNALDLTVFDSLSDLGGEGREKSLSRAQLLSQTLRRLVGAIAQSPTAFIFINRSGRHGGSGGRAIRFYASVRLLVERSAWLRDGEDVIGCRSTVHVLKNKLAPPLRQAEIEVLYENSLCPD